MDEREQIGRRARAFFDDLWGKGDVWELETCPFERAKYDRQLCLLAGRRFGRALEIGCGAGAFTRSLARVADRVVALDVSPAAIERARAAAPGPGVDHRAANIMDFDLRADGPWDLVVFSETVYYLGWLYSFFDVSWLAAELFATTAAGGRLLMANTCGGVDDYLLRPWVIRTYRDLFVNVGYRPEAEEVFRGAKHGADLEVLITLFGKGV